MKTPSLFKSYSFTRSERLALVIIAILSIFFCVLPGLYRMYRAKFHTRKHPIDTAWMSKIKEDAPLSKNTPSVFIDERSEGEQAADTPVLFYFDPNTASLEELQQLGLKKRVAHTIINYRNKGGKFRRKADLKKIYGFSEQDYLRLHDWIRIEPPKRTTQHFMEKTTPRTNPTPDTAMSKGPQHRERHRTAKSKWENPVIDINMATIEEWQKLRGIGPAYSKRIVNFREKLGGFYAVEQVGETYGVPDSVFQKIKPYLKVSPIYRTINLNSVDLKTLQKHPYIRYKEARVLFNYMEQHRPVTDMEQLRNAMSIIFTKERWAKLEPYLNLHN